MLETSACVHIFAPFSLLPLAGLVLVVSRLHNELAEVRAVVEAVRTRGDQHRRLAQLAMVDWTSATSRSGCVRVDVSSGDVLVELSTASCNGHACPPCFGLNTTQGIKLHIATFSKCAEMLVSDTQQLGFGAFQGALQPLEFINLSPDNSVAISDGARDFLIPPGAHVRGACVAGGSHEIHLNTSLRKHLRPGSTWSPLSTASSWAGRKGHASVVRTDGAVLVLGGRGANDTRLNEVHASADGGTKWARLTAAAAWSPRNAHAAVVRLDGVLLVLGGRGGDGLRLNDVYGSADGGATWAPLTASAAWGPRSSFAAVVCADGAVLVLGGTVTSTGRSNDVYRSEDGGVAWSQRTASAPWSARANHAAVVRTDGAVLVLGGEADDGPTNDVYSSQDGGATWQLLTASAAWSARAGLVAVVRADGAVVILGGASASSLLNDVYSSDDGGATWALLTAAAAWNPRRGHTAVVRADGALLVPGGEEDTGRTNTVYVSEL